MQLEIFEQGPRVKKEIKTHRDISGKTSEFKFPTQLYIKFACLIIVIIMSFALGVERGKIISRKEISTRFQADSKSPEITKNIATKDEKIQKQPVDNKKLEKKVKDEKIQTSGYIIQVASYKKNSSYIEKEITKLQRNGYDTLTISGGEYMGICAGKFTNKKEAQKHQKELQRTYKDCFIRKL
ncbi:MAG: SPOR domain-containing protein [Candidatus Omnitrophica bacterium]|nr:SPOR domain-containing protein [Candidatus Omnitrophota bacterium]